MTVKFDKMFSKYWLTFPLAIDWEDKSLIYMRAVGSLGLHFLWWHCRWTFIKERR